MRIHHLNCGCMCPVGGALFDGFSTGWTAHLVCHCLAIETEAGIVLVDTGFGRQDVAVPHRRLSGFFRAFNNIQFRDDYTAVAQLLRLGLNPADVRHIVLTHLDFDHAGGLDDFPGATVHLLQDEMEAVRQRRGFIGTRRYSPAQWEGVKAWQFYTSDGDRWFDFSAVRQLVGLPPEILLVPLAGHTLGHAGVAIEGDGEWLLHAGDAYFYRDEVGHEHRHCPPGLRFYQWMMAQDRSAQRQNQARLRSLSLQRKSDIRMVCSHDAKELEAARQEVRNLGVYRGDAANFENETGIDR